MDDLSSQDLNFTGPATPGATPEWDLYAGMLQAIQQRFGCPDINRLARTLAYRLERFIALLGSSAEALDVNRLWRPAESFSRIHYGIHESAGPAGVHVRPLGLSANQRGNVKLLPEAFIVKMNVRVALELKEWNEGR